MSSTNPAYLAICAAVRAIPPGCVSSYGAIAARAGLPGRARLVAKAMSGADEPDLPWYRVLRSNGQIAFPKGSSGYREQLRHLKAEGVVVKNGRVDLTRFGAFADQDLDRALWGF